MKRRARTQIDMSKDLDAMVRSEAKRLDRPYCWVIERSIRAGISSVQNIPSIPEVG